MAGKIGKALGFSMDLGETPKEKSLGINEGDLPRVDTSADEGDSDDDMGEDSVSDPKVKPDAMGPEVLAMRMFDRAKTPEAKVEALKAFGEACGWSSGEY